MAVNLDLQVPAPLLLLERLADCPDQTFLTEVNGAHVTFQQFYDRTQEWVSILKAAGVDEGDRVGVLLSTSIEAHCVWLACAWLKAWEVPINNAFKGPMLRHVLDDAGVSCLIVQPAFVPQLAEIVNSCESVSKVVVTEPADAAGITCSVHLAADLMGLESVTHALPPLTAGDVASVIYTSGTTGPSKGCVVPWGEFFWGLDIFQPTRDGTDCHYCPFPINHLSGKVPIYNMLAFSGKVVLKERFSTDAFWSDIRHHQCTTTILLGGLASFIFRQPASDDDANNPLRTILMGPALPEYREFEARFDVRIVAAYGMTEIAWPFMSLPGQLPNGETCGVLREGWEVRIVDANGDIVGDGEIGELWVRCAHPESMMKEYINRPDATKTAWEGGWFHTGDAMKRDADGNYYFVDRIKDAIRRRGENISSFEVENYIKLHPAVLDCAAIAVAADTGEDEVKTIIVPKPDQSLDPEDLIRFLIPRMPDFMIPRYVEIADALPITPTNKVRKKELREKGVTSDTWDRVAAGVKIK